MKKHIKSMGLSRREFLGATGAGALTMGMGLPAMAAGEEVRILIVNSAVAGPMKEVIESKAGVTLADGPFVSSTDNISKFMTPGPSQYDLFAGVSELSRPPVMGEKAGMERGLAFDPALVPNTQYLTEVAKADLGVRDGKMYVIPVYSGFDMAIYNRDEVPEDDPLTQSWGVLFAEKYEGRIGWFDAPHQMLMIAGLHLGHEAPEEADDADLKEFAKFLTSKKKLVRALWTKPAQAANLLTTGEVVVTYGFIPVRKGLEEQGMNVANNWPSEGLLVWTNGAYLPQRSNAPEAAQRVVNAMLTPEYGSALTRQTGYLSVTTQAQSQFSEEDLTRYGYDVAERGIKTHGLKYPVDFPKWVEIWGAVKSA